MEKKLFRSKTDKKIAGVCGGLAQYLEMDSTVVRLLWIVLSFFAGSVILLYLICALIMPVEQ